MQLAAFAMVAVMMMAIGLLMMLSGVSTRSALAIEERSHRGLGRFSVGIVLMSVPVLLGLFWALATVVLDGIAVR